MAFRNRTTFKIENEYGSLNVTFLNWRSEVLAGGRSSRSLNLVPSSTAGSAIPTTSSPSLFDID